MNPGAALSRSVSGKHLSFRSNLHGLGARINAPSPAAADCGTRRGVRRLSDSLSFGSPRLYADECENNRIVSEGKFGFDYAKERLEKRQIFLRSYHLTTKAEATSSAFSRKLRGCLFKIRGVLWTVFACNPPRSGGHNRFALIHHQGNPASSSQSGGHNRFLRIHRHGNASSSQSSEHNRFVRISRRGSSSSSPGLCEQSW